MNRGWAGIVVALCLAPQTCVAQMVAAPLTAEESGSVSYEYLSHQWGFTICYHKVGHSYVKGGLSEIDRLDTEAHEAKHREQYTRFPSCEAFWAYYATFKGKLLIEAEGYAAGLCVSVAHGADRISLERNYAEKIAHHVLNRQMPEPAIVGFIQQFETCLPPAKDSS